MFLITLLAQTPAPTSSPRPGSSGLSSILFFAVIIGAFYFLMIRPQRSRQRQHQDMVRAIEVGDEVETAGGMYGKVARATDDIVWVEVIPGQPPIKMSRAAIRRRVIDTGDRN